MGVQGQEGHGYFDIRGGDDSDCPNDLKEHSISEFEELMEETRRTLNQRASFSARGFQKPTVARGGAIESPGGRLGGLAARMAARFDQQGAAGPLPARRPGSLAARMAERLAKEGKWK